MTTVAQLIAHLQTLPQDAIVQCLAETHYNTFTWKNLNIDYNINVVDLRGNQFIQPDDIRYDKVFVEIGDKW